MVSFPRQSTTVSRAERNESDKQVVSQVEGRRRNRWTLSLSHENHKIEHRPGVRMMMIVRTENVLFCCLVRKEVDERKSSLSLSRVLSDDERKFHFSWEFYLRLHEHQIL